MARAAKTKKPTRIQRDRIKKILAAALEVFSTYGYRGSTIDQIATTAGMSKPNLLYYFDSKEAIHAALLGNLLEMWQEPMRQIDPNGEPIEEIWAYVKRKLELSRVYPRESRLFASEVFQGAPHISGRVSGPMKDLVDEKAEVIEEWVTQGKLADIDAYHLIFSIWATTQHYADFDTQVRALLQGTEERRFRNAETYLEHLFKTALKP